ncbi:MAG: secretion system X translation initiation factor [Proteobacteria bacterium]|nr:secretion system X translation initiation factor [Pseudomonadota bacterium]
MRIRPANRRPLLFGAALFATLAATWWAATLENEVAPPVSRPGAAAPAARRSATSAPALRTPAGRGTVAAPAILAVGRTPWPAEGGALMAGSAPPVAVLQAPPPAPPTEATLPPLPFRFAGLIEERGQRSVVLLEGRDVRILRAGERIDERYRVDRITPTRIEFTYLPLRQQQSLQVSDHEPTQ